MHGRAPWRLSSAIRVPDVHRKKALHFLVIGPRRRHELGTVRARRF
jgi:hypothetical protein